MADLVVGDRPARLYRPYDAPASPLVLWLHGGGWTIGGLDSFDRMARRSPSGCGRTASR